MRGNRTRAHSFHFGTGQSITAIVMPSAKPVVDLMLKSFTETLIEDKVKARIDGSIGVRPKVECKDQRSRQAAVLLEIKRRKKVIDVRWKPTNGEK